MTADMYQLHGEHLGVTYYPGGFGPPVQGRGRMRLGLRNDVGSHAFYDADVRVTSVAGLGDIVQVTMPNNGDVVETIGILIPPVSPTTALPAAIRSLAITHGQLASGRATGIDLYDATALRGFAENVIIPLVTKPANSAPVPVG